MLLDDSIELDYYNYSASAEPLPMNWDLDLSKIWIPSSLLPNRRKQMSANENKSFVSHTLVKPDYSNTFSVYADECLQYHESQTSSAVPYKISHHNLKNNDIDKLHAPLALPSSQNTVKWNEKSDTENKKEISQGPSVNNTKLKDFLRNSQHDDSVIRNAARCGKKTSDTYLEQKIRGKPSLEDLTHRMAEILSEDEPFKENWHHEDVINTNAGATAPILDSIPPSAKDSLEELYFSDEDENEFDIEEYKLGNVEIKFPGLELTKNSSDKIVRQPYEEIEKIPSEEQKVTFDQREKHELKEIESVDHTKDFVQKLPNSEGEWQDTTEQVVEYLPVAYKRPPLKEHKTLKVSFWDLEN
ncbi:hypothetical protein HNY73_011795 [Argiope bruennichi]|uniref:Uncharacterized protein n=1 Tax=Argiope bruennichi TaxID=94029 RepID=A0A8T0ESY2_ARGBR|nr:hypothetical protein HNY73_011795 [Argiope bruennichi]